jgi:hypothetical protein
LGKKSFGKEFERGNTGGNKEVNQRIYPGISE